jgi:hypothetical protein
MKCSKTAARRCVGSQPRQPQHCAAVARSDLIKKIANAGAADRSVLGGDDRLSHETDDIVAFSREKLRPFSKFRCISLSPSALRIVLKPANHQETLMLAQSP